MGLIDTINADVAAITSNLADFGVNIKLTSPGSVLLTTVGLHVKHNLGISSEGLMVQAKKASIAISEKTLTDAGYPCRTSSQEVSLLGHQIEVKDSSGIEKKYVVEQNYPDETIGLIVCILGDIE